MYWKDYREEIKKKKIKGASWISDRESLLKMLDHLELLSVKPPAKEISLSNLRTLIKYLRKPISDMDTEKITEMLTLASELSNRDLRLHLGSATLEEVKVHRIPDTPIPKYQLTLTREQLDKLAAKTKASFDFQIIEQNNKILP